MQEETKTLIETLAWITGFAMVMEYGKYLVSNEPIKIRILIGQAIINALFGSTALVYLAFNPAADGKVVYGIALAIIVIGPVAFKILLMKIINKVIGDAGSSSKNL